MMVMVGVVVCGGGSAVVVVACGEGIRSAWWWLTVHGGDGRSSIRRGFTIYCLQRATRDATSGCRERGISNRTCSTPLRIHKRSGKKMLGSRVGAIFAPINWRKNTLGISQCDHFCRGKTRSIHPQKKQKTPKQRTQNPHIHTPVSPTPSSPPTWTTPCYHSAPAVATTTDAPATPRVLFARLRPRLP